MRIGVGLHLLAPDNGGVTNYALTLLRLWPELMPEHPMILFSFPHNEALLATLPPATRRHEIRLNTQEEALLHFDQIDVYFCPFGTLWPRPVHKPAVLTFHDMQERFYPENFTEKELAERFFHYDWSLRMADGVVAISEFTREMAVRLAGVPRSKCHVVHHVPDELPEPRIPTELGKSFPGRPFLFYPANVWKHKNHRALLAAFAQVCSRGSNLTLICTGSLLGRETEWAEILGSAGLEGKVLHLGKVSRVEISWLFRHARALIFASRFEGFGIPLIEAMQTGCPIACGRNTSQSEVAQDAALYFNADDPTSIAAAIERIVQDEPLRRRLVDAGTRRLQNFTAEKLINGHLRAFQAAIRRYSPLRDWYNEHVRLPRSQLPRTALTRRERRRAQRLLAARANVPSHYESIPS